MDHLSCIPNYIFNIAADSKTGYIAVCQNNYPISLRQSSEQIRLFPILKQLESARLQDISVQNGLEFNFIIFPLYNNSLI